ncbi:hypothetical protein Acr_23g0013930 [Actinidia rufa]|uniref:Uncharacterized protein n=1 Tax=Actinidia rufa TaxID=165716 RepID=A0A7J0GQI4_9ERIC|nr:hypothetical protein Acr_23g0013930 [Actinidia rufa]
MKAVSGDFGVKGGECHMEDALWWRRARWRLARLISSSSSSHPQSDGRGENYGRCGQHPKKSELNELISSDKVSATCFTSTGDLGDVHTSLGIRLSMGRILPCAAVHNKSATFAGTFASLFPILVSKEMRPPYLPTGLYILHISLLCFSDFSPFRTTLFTIEILLAQFI